MARRSTVSGGGLTIVAMTVSLVAVFVPSFMGG